MKATQTISLLLALCLCGCPLTGPQPEPVQPATFEPARETLHRLTRAELRNTIRDLLDTDIDASADLPPDDFGDGFDNQSAVLSFSPLHLELWELSVNRILEEAVAAPLVTSQLWRAEAEGPDVEYNTGGSYADGWVVWSNGYIDTFIELPAAGSYRFAVRVFGHQAGEEPVLMSLRVDGLDIETLGVEAEELAPIIEERTLQLSGGIHSFGAGFLNDLYLPDEGLDRNLCVDWIEVEGPLDASGERPPGFAKVFTCSVKQLGEVGCAKHILRGFAARAWRRPLAEGELNQLIDLFSLSQQSGGAWHDSVLLALKAVLISPHFLYRVEADPAPNTATPHPLTAFELAARLSYFLWSSLPDDELFQAAADGSILSDPVLEAQTRRMLGHWKAEALIDSLAGQWLWIRAIDDISPDPWAYPDWDESLRASMRTEMELLASDILLKDRSMLDILTADESFLDTNMAQHYGLGASPTLFTRLPLPAGRSGLLTTAGLLAALSYPTRTSPVKRGKWVTDNILCESPPPPPAGVEGLLEDELGELSLREQMERHRADPACSGCHTLMDPIGFGLERFDGIGARRDLDDLGFPVDDSGVLPDDLAFSGAVELAQLLAVDERVPRCMTEKVATYAFSRPPTPADRAALLSIEQEFVAGGHRFADLAAAIVLSAPFRTRRGEVPPDPEATP